MSVAQPKPVRWPHLLATLVAAAAGAVLAVAQVGTAELAGITTLGADFTAGNERVQGVQVTLVTWYCAVAVPLAVTIAGAGRVVGVGIPSATVPAAAVGALAAIPLLAGRSGDFIRADAVSGAVAGTLLGLAAGLGVAAAPAVGKGLAAYVALLWTAALAFTLSVPRTVVYAGLVEPLGLEILRELRSPVRALPYIGNLDYHLPFMVPVTIAVVVLSGLLAATAMRRTGSWGRSVAVATSGPVFTAVVYWLDPDQLYLWNEAAATVVLAVAVLCLLAAAVTATVARNR